ncbi:DUF1885 family protein [Bacillus infantis]|uniref:DUF1885 family protein n=1 Tax=Bacillus infantis TaxID=324767 RepID=UPI001CD79957|nr:DUF1885 family protein [Bacillus infantis]MCA1041026.1 DUF1885 family protein [Bacillus infantis]
MSSSAYIKLVKTARQETITLEEVKDLLEYYKSITAKTGDQVDWGYSRAAFPYEIKEHAQGDGKWFWLKSVDDRYNTILIGVGTETVQDADRTDRIQSYIQLTLPENAAMGDKSKANEFCRFLAKKLQAELQLFNGRIMYFNGRK